MDGGAQMRFYVAFLLAFVTTFFGLQSRAAQPLKSSHIHWSTPSNLRSPDGKWTIYVRPANSGDAPADVYLSRIGTDFRSHLFELQRDAEVYWRPTGGVVVIGDQKSSNDYRVLVFILNAASQKSALVLNEKIAQDVKQRLGEGSQIAYYFPRFSQWSSDGHLVISVGVVTVRNGSGPFTAHCFGYIADAESQNIRSTLSESQLKEKYGASCQIWP
jgi:hypothetical protein